MEIFPELLEGQVALMRVERNTGIVLDIDFSYAQSNDQRVFSIFDSYDSAVAEVKSIQLSRPDVELTIYGRNMSLMKRFVD